MSSSILSSLLLVFGFGFVIFWHELGHFLAAKWAGVKVEQFAVGFGQALVCWRKGLGFTWGSSQEAFRNKVIAHLESHATEHPDEKFDNPNELQIARAAAEINISETEYRLNWIPLGGYVKMLGQDDLRPNAVANDPRSYNNKTIGQRMVIVSAGVIMNVILAAIGFMVAFLIGLRASPAIVGNVQPGSPAQMAYQIVDGKHAPAPLQPGYTILKLDGRDQADFTKIGMNVALSEENKPITAEVRRAATGKVETVMVVPTKPKELDKGFLMLGIEQPYQLLGLDPKDVEKIELPPRELTLDDQLPVQPGEKILAINGKRVEDPKQFWILSEAVQNCAGKPVKLTVQDDKGAQRQVSVQPRFIEPFSKDPLNFAGMQPRMMISAVMEKSPARNIIKPGDVFTAAIDLSTSHDKLSDPSRLTLVKFLNEAGDKDLPVSLVVLRDGKETTIDKITPNYAVEAGRKGLGVQLEPEANLAIVADTLEGSPAAQAGIPKGAKIISVAGQNVTNWSDVDTALKQNVYADKPFDVVAEVGGQQKAFTIPAQTTEQLAVLQQNRYAHGLILHEYEIVRKTTNPLTAASWGIGETRDAIAQVYLTVQRMTQGSVSYKNVSGPLGIFIAGYSFAHKGATWLIWFLSIISANLAVMNFLPIPIVDGGLFTFLIIEKIKGSPVSQRVQSVAQMVGLGILLSVFVLATWQDIFRLPFLNH